MTVKFGTYVLCYYVVAIATYATINRSRANGRKDLYKVRHALKKYDDDTKQVLFSTMTVEALIFAIVYLISEFSKTK
jgi:hypothetical protein